MLIGDNRECAKAVNEMMHEAQTQRSSPVCSREVEYHPVAHVFGHYDSRGGAFLLLGWQHTPTAMIAYEEMCGAEPEYDLAHEDFLAKVDVIVCDRPLPAEDEELLEGYAEEGYRAARLQSRWYNRYADGGPAWTAWEDQNTLVLFRPQAEEPEEDDSRSDYDGRPVEEMTLTPGPNLLQYEYRLVVWELGEDACGLGLCRKPAEDPAAAG